MQFQNRILFIIGALVLGAAVVAAVLSTRPYKPEETFLPTPSSTASVLPSPSYFPEGISDLIPVCSLTGTIEFLSSDGLFRHKDAFFRYDMVGDPHDLIVWRVSPEGEDITIGPNRFSALPLPKGQETLTLNFPASPQRKEYRLYASVQYPYFVNGQVEVLTKECSGSIRLIVL